VGSGAREGWKFFCPDIARQTLALWDRENGICRPGFERYIVDAGFSGIEGYLLVRSKYRKTLGRRGLGSLLGTGVLDLRKE